MDFAPEYNDFVQNHLPKLYQSVIGIAHEDANGEECIGSGVFVKAQGPPLCRVSKTLRRVQPQSNDRWIHRADE